MTQQMLKIEDRVEGPIPPRVVNASLPNMLQTRVKEVVKEMGPPPWSKRIIADERNTVTLIANAPGTGNRPHWHGDFDEYWVVDPILMEANAANADYNCRRLAYNTGHLSTGHRIVRANALNGDGSLNVTQNGGCRTNRAIPCCSQ